MSVDLPTVWQSARPKARKRHRCIECTGVIEPGEHYERFTGLWDGEWSTYCTCTECDELRSEVNANRSRHDDIVGFGELYQSWYEDEFDVGQRLQFLNTVEKRGAWAFANQLRQSVEGVSIKF